MTHRSKLSIKKFIYLKHGDFRLEIFKVTGAESMPESRRYPNQDIATHGTKHIAFEVPDVSSTMDYLEERGVDIAMRDPAFIRDNSGILIELIDSSANF